MCYNVPVVVCVNEITDTLSPNVKRPPIIDSNRANHFIFFFRGATVELVTPLGFQKNGMQKVIHGEIYRLVDDENLGSLSGLPCGSGTPGTYMPPVYMTGGTWCHNIMAGCYCIHCQKGKCATVIGAQYNVVCVAPLPCMLYHLRPRPPCPGCKPR
jgi:hypothetical protein